MHSLCPLAIHCAIRPSFGLICYYVPPLGPKDLLWYIGTFVHPLGPLGLLEHIIIQSEGILNQHNVHMDVIQIDPPFFLSLLNIL